MKERHKCLSWKKISSLVWLYLLGRRSSAAAGAPTALSEVLTTGKCYQFPFEKHWESQTANCTHELQACFASVFWESIWLKYSPYRNTV